MNWKNEVIDKLRNYNAHRAALLNIPAEIQRLETICEGLRTTELNRSADEDLQAWGENAVLSNIIYRDELKQQQRVAKQWVARMDKALAALDDDDRQILNLCFIQKASGAMGELCRQLCVGQSTAYRRRDEALLRFTQALYGPLPGL